MNKYSLTNKDIEFANQLAMKLGRSLLGDKIEKATTMEDLKQESLLGLCEAAERFDPTKEVEFQTYAFDWCRKYVLRALRKYGTPVSVPDNWEGVSVSLLHMDAGIEDVTSGYDNEGNDDGSPADRIFYMIAMSEQAEREAQDELKECIAAAMGRLNTKERQTITLIFGLNGAKEHSIQEAAAVLCVSSGRITQLKEQALVKMEQ